MGKGARGSSWVSSTSRFCPDLTNKVSVQRITSFRIKHYRTFEVGQTPYETTSSHTEISDAQMTKSSASIAP